MNDVSQWLQQLGLDQYVSAFAENDIDADILRELNDSDLKDIGITSLGHRKRILKAIANLAKTGVEHISTEAPASGPAVSRATASAEAERRQLTVMFCDLVGSTELAARLDPEDLQELMRAFQDKCAGAISRFGGFIARYMGDGLLVYFGFPQAHENEAERAVRAGLDIVSAMDELNGDVGEPKGVALSVRVGIATGLVVVGDIVGEGAASESAVIGETPNLAARLQSVARQNQVLVSASTRALLPGGFTCRDLGPRSLKGVGEAVPVWAVTGTQDGEREAGRSRSGGRSPLVGRQEELGLLVRAWETSKEGLGQVVLVNGDPGIGKSRLVEALRERIVGQDHLWVPVRCSPYHTQSALYPVVEQLKRAVGWESDDPTEARLTKLEKALDGYSFPLEEVVPLYAALFSLDLPEGRYPPLELTPQQQKRLTLDAVAGWLLEEAERRPVLQVWEDIHWADPTTLELLNLYVEQAPTVALLNLVTFRPDFTPPWPHRSHVTPVTLNRLERVEVEAVIDNLIGGKELPAEVVEHIAGKADGVPLFVEELTKSVVESTLLEEQADRYTLRGSLAEVQIPATLQDALMSRLDKLPGVRELAQLGAILGREFAYEMLRALASMDDSALSDGLGRLVSAELLYQRGRPPRARYIFKHALIQDAAYHSLLKRSRQRFHRQAAEMLERQFPELATTQPELVAHHYDEAACPELAMSFWKQAAQRAIDRSAYVEAIHSLDQALTQLAQLSPGNTRDRRELELQVMKIGPLFPVKGYGSPEIDATTARALELNRSVGDNETLFPTLYARWAYQYVTSRQQDALEASQEYLDRARTAGDEAVPMVSIGYRVHAVGLLMGGEVRGARDHVHRALELYDPEQHEPLTARLGQNVRVQVLNYVAVIEALCGNIDDALAAGKEAVSHARSLGHVNTLAYALWHICIWLPAILRDTPTLFRHGPELIELCEQHRLAFWAAITRPYLLAHGHQTSQELAAVEAESALGDYRREFNSVLAVPELLCHVASAYLDASRLSDASRILDEAESLIEKSGQCYWESEVYRLRGNIETSEEQAGLDTAGVHLERAVGMAHQRGIRLLELRAASDRARIESSRQNRAEARKALAIVYDTFTQGFESQDVRDAKSILDALA